jgi:hypothetical protein
MLLLIPYFKVKLQVEKPLVLSAKSYIKLYPLERGIVVFSILTNSSGILLVLDLLASNNDDIRQSHENKYSCTQYVPAPGALAAAAVTAAAVTAAANAPGAGNSGSAAAAGNSGNATGVTVTASGNSDADKDKLIRAGFDKTKVNLLDYTSTVYNFDAFDSPNANSLNTVRFVMNDKNDEGIYYNINNKLYDNERFQFNISINSNVYTFRKTVQDTIATPNKVDVEINISKNSCYELNGKIYKIVEIKNIKRIDNERFKKEMETTDADDPQNTLDRNPNGNSLIKITVQENGTSTKRELKNGQIIKELFYAKSIDCNDTTTIVPPVPTASSTTAVGNPPVPTPLNKTSPDFYLTNITNNLNSKIENLLKTPSSSPPASQVLLASPVADAAASSAAASSAAADEDV